MQKELEILKEFNSVCNKLKKIFVKKYFGKTVSDVYWVSDEIGGVLAINDYFFSLSDMVDFLRYNYPVAKMFEYYDKRLEAEKKDLTFVNIKHFIKK